MRVQRTRREYLPSVKTKSVQIRDEVSLKMRRLYDLAVTLTVEGQGEGILHRLVHVWAFV